MNKLLPVALLVMFIARSSISSTEWATGALILACCWFSGRKHSSIFDGYCTWLLALGCLFTMGFGCQLQAFVSWFWAASPRQIIIPCQEHNWSGGEATVVLRSRVSVNPGLNSDDGMIRVTHRGTFAWHFNCVNWGGWLVKIPIKWTGSSNNQLCQTIRQCLPAS